MHFIFLSILCWFCFSVFNVLVAILTVSTDSIIKRHPRAVFVIEFILTSIVSGSLVGLVFAGCSYAPDPLLVYTCVPQGHDNLFYTITLPVQIFCICGMAMSMLIIRRLKKVQYTVSRHTKIQGRRVAATIEELPKV